MRRPRELLVVLALLLAGCNGIVGDPGPATPPSTVTPMPVPDTGTDAPSGENGANGTGLPPGVSENGSVDLGALLAAHNDVLSNRSYRVNATRDVVDTRDGDRHVRNTTARLDIENESRYRIATVEENEPVRRAEYVDGTATYEREVRNGTVSVDVIDRVRPIEWRLEPSFFPHRPGLGPREAHVTAIERGNRTFYRIHVPSYPGEEEPVIAYSATLYATPDGFVRTVVVERRVEIVDGERFVRQRYAFSDVGGVELSEPEWVTRLRSNRTTETDSPDVAAPSG